MVPRAELIRDHDDESEVHRALSQHTIQVSFCGFLWLFLLSPHPRRGLATDPHAPPTVASLKSRVTARRLCRFLWGEELSFEVRWMGLLAGNARMAVNWPSQPRRPRCLSYSLVGRIFSILFAILLCA